MKAEVRVSLCIFFSWPSARLLIPPCPPCSWRVGLARCHSPCSCSPTGSGGWSPSSGPGRGAPTARWSCTARCRPCPHTRGLRRRRDGGNPVESSVSCVSSILRSALKPTGATLPPCLPCDEINYRYWMFPVEKMDVHGKFHVIVGNSLWEAIRGWNIVRLVWKFLRYLCLIFQNTLTDQPFGGFMLST